MKQRPEHRPFARARCPSDEHMGAGEAKAPGITVLAHADWDASQVGRLLLCDGLHHRPESVATVNLQPDPSRFGRGHPARPGPESMSHSLADLLDVTRGHAHRQLA